MESTRTRIAIGAFIALVAIVVSAYCSISLPSPKVEETSFELHLNDTINKKLSSKANYDYGNDTINIPEQCKIIHTETIQRHGARHVNKISKLEEIEKRFSLLNSRGEFKSSLLMDWIHNLIDKERGNEGSICKTGEAEIQGIAKRMRERLNMDKDQSGDIIIENTFKQRTIQTRDVFLSSFLPESFPKSHIHYKHPYQCDDIFNPDGSINQDHFYDYASLRYYTLCPNYKKAINEEFLVKAVNQSFYNIPEFNTLRTDNNMWRDIFIQNNTLSDIERRDVVKDMYLMCQYEASCYNDYSHNCDRLLREPGILDQLVYDEDMRLYAFKGEGAPIYYRMAFPLAQSILRGLAKAYMDELQDPEEKKEFFEKFNPYFNLTSVEPSRIHMRFAHAESILPLYFLFIMKIPRIQVNKMGFSGNDYIPMSANMQWNLLKCGDKMYISQLTNEMETPLSARIFDENHRMVFSMIDLFDQWLMILDNHELINNHLDDFYELCGGVECIKKDSFVC